MTLAGLIIFQSTIYIVYRLIISDKRLIPISVIAIIAGVIFESKRLSDKWSTIFFTASGAFIFSLIGFSPNIDEQNYSFENRVEIFPYSFIIFFAIFSIIVHRDKVVPKLNEGITLLQSLAVFYWVLDYGYLNINNIFLNFVIIIGLLFSLYSLFHAFTNTTLTKTSRLTLSIWSSILMMLFASENIYLVYQNEQIENVANLTNGLKIALQFFLLGVSSIYIIQNFLILVRFLPSKSNFFNAQYFIDLKELKNEHIKRYSGSQVNIIHSFFCLVFSVIIFGLNYQYQIIPRQGAIWLVFVTFPFILIICDEAIRKKI